MRLFLRVHKYAPIIGLEGDMRWVSVSVDVYMLRFWKDRKYEVR